MTMVFPFFLVPFLTTVALVSRGAVAQDVDDLFGPQCANQTFAMVNCFLTEGALLPNSTTFENLDIDGCQTCIEGTDTIQDVEQLKQTPCSEVEALLVESLTSCSSQCAFGGCTTEVTDLLSCGIGGTIECKSEGSDEDAGSGGVAVPTFGWLAAIAAMALTIVFVA